MRLPSTHVTPSSDWVLQLINIVFLLLLFFLANGTILTRQELGIEPPRSAIIEQGAPPGDAIYIDASGGMKFRGNVTNAAAIAGLLSKNPTEATKLGLQIIADRRLKAAVLIDRLRDMKRNGLIVATLLTIRDQPQ